MNKTGIVLLLFASIGYCQYSFDVKTTFSEKHQLQIAKLGLLQAIDESSWATTEEAGEDFSLWLTSFNRYHQNDSVYVSLQVQLRSRAMFTSGTMIAHRNVLIRYHWEETQAFAADSINKDLFNDNQENTEKVTKSMIRMASFASTFSGVGFLGAEEILGGMTSTFIASSVGALGGVLQKQPSPVEVLESLLLGNRVLELTKEMVVQRN